MKSTKSCAGQDKLIEVKLLRRNFYMSSMTAHCYKVWEGILIAFITKNEIFEVSKLFLNDWYLPRPYQFDLINESAQSNITWFCFSFKFYLGFYFFFFSLFDCFVMFFFSLVLIILKKARGKLKAHTCLQGYWH